MKLISEKKIKAAKNLIQNAKKIAVLGHYKPDGDAVGAASGLYEVLKNYGTEPSLIMPSKIADAISGIPHTDKILFHDDNKTESETALKACDLLFCVDFNAYKRVGEELMPFLKSLSCKKIMLDHHPEPENCSDIIISDTQVSSASEVAYEFLHLLGFQKYFSPKAAESFFTGIMTDTNNFSVNCSRRRTFEIAAELLGQGIDREQIYDRVYNRYNESRLRFTGFFLHKKMRILAKYNTAFALISLADQKQYSFKHGDQEGLVNLPLSLENVELSVFAMQTDKFVKYSFRSKSYFDVNAFARKYYDGGGHKRAAGGKSYDIPISELEHVFTERLKEFLEQK